MSFTHRPCSLAHRSTSLAFCAGTGSDGLSVSYLSTQFDSVSYDNGQTFPDPDGASINLDPLFANASDNDDGLYWCAATSVFFGDPAVGDAQYGTPGTVNDSCPFHWMKMVTATPMMWIAMTTHGPQRPLPSTRAPPMTALTDRPELRWA